MDEGGPRDGDEQAPEPARSELRPWTGSLRTASLAAGAVQRPTEPVATPHDHTHAEELAPALAPEPEPAVTVEPPLAETVETVADTPDVRTLGYLLLAIFATYVLCPVLPAATGALGVRVSLYGSSIVFFGLVVWAILVAVPLGARPPRVLGLSVLAAAAIAMLGNVAGLPVASDLAKLAFASGAAFLILRAVERMWWLLPICVFVPLADAWSVYSSRGVTNTIVEQSKQDRAWIDWPTIVTPTPGFDFADAARIGIVDIFFCALFVAAATRWALRPVLTTCFLAGSFVLSTLVAAEIDESGVPALPLLCIAFLLVNWRPLVDDLRAELRDT